MLTLHTLRARNIALMAVVLLLAQVLTALLLSVLLIRPQADRVAGIIAHVVATVGTTLDALPEPQRRALLARLDDAGGVRIRPANAAPPAGRGTPTLLERVVLLQVAADLGAAGSMEWRGGGAVPLWLKLPLGTRYYWVSVAPPGGFTPNGALLASVGVALLLALVAGIILQRRINRPLRALADAVDAYPAAGDSHVPATPIGAAALRVAGPQEVEVLAAAFNRLAARLEQQEADRTFMLAGISHDLRTPLAKLRLGLALNPPASSDDGAMLDRQLDRMDAMLVQFLDFARGIDAEPVEAVDAGGALRATIAQAAPAVVAFAGGDGLMLRVRPQAFERALGNLVRNAMVHGAPPVVVAARRDGALVRIEVRDAGPGVPADLLPRLHEPFVRADAARGSAGGAGLGLAIAWRFARQHGGTLLLADAPGGGLLATLALPAG